MLHWALIFLAFALVAGAVGFSGVASASAGVAQMLFVLFIAAFLIALVTKIIRKGS